MRFVEIEHSELGQRTFVPETRVPHLGEGWAVVEGDEPKTKGDPKRVTPTWPPMGAAGAGPVPTPPAGNGDEPRRNEP